MSIVRLVRSIPKELYLVIAALVLLVACAESLHPERQVSSVVVTPGDVTLASIGDTVALTAVAKDAAGSEIEGKAFTWSSSGPVVNVNDDGIAVATASGTATVTVTADGKSGSATVQVVQALDSIALSTRSINMGSINQTAVLTATALDARNNPIDGMTATWATDAPGVATVGQSSGSVKAVGNGEATVTATIGALSAPVQVSVVQVPSQLAFIAQPITTQKTVAIPAVKVALRDALGTTVAGATKSVSLALGPNLANGVLSGTTTVDAVNGVATFTGLSVDVAATYTLAASAAGTSFATSSAFDVMDTPARIDSVKIASLELKSTGATNFQIWLTNGAGRNLSGAFTQGYIVVNGNLHGAGGFQVSGCSPTGGVMPHGSCKLDRTLSLNGVPVGPATVRIVFGEGGVELDRVEVPVTIVPSSE